ncbi:hypothetical protein DCS_01849 [Drechmeria coniospora]|uniref:GPI anchored protein n=1 Tax=Drechmeria coniospora TaxID=98403 RepID=A0A151GUG5_DRECN|nr:hypothetical protein DCS_01849 [Drechmeria coniospora]KYK60711.1 hypothetical protein DCS_01849 [Drechmeria coniospora]
MLPRRPLLAAAAGVGVTAATTTVDLFIPLLSRTHQLVGSVVNVDSDATTYAITCGPEVRKNVCFIGGTDSLTMVRGPSTVSLSFVDTQRIGKASAILTEEMICSSDSPSHGAACDVMRTETNAMGIQLGTFHTSIPDYEALVYPVTMTAGAEKLTSSPPTVKTGASLGPNPTMTVTNTAAGNPSSTSSTTSTSSIGNPAATQNTLLAAAAALIAGAALLL